MKYFNKKLLYSICIIILVSIAVCILGEESYEKFTNYYRCSKYKMNNGFEYALQEINGVMEYKNWDLYIPCSYTKVEKELAELNLSKNKAVFGISGTDLIASKNILYDILKKKFGSNVINYYPKSYIPKRKSDIDLFKKEYNDNKFYIAKENLQQQKGINLSNNFNELLDYMENGKVDVIQELLEDPLIVGGRKINMRVYFLIICKDNKKYGYIFDDGFIYYTRKEYNKNILHFDHHITTGYIDREVYDKNPLTHKDLYNQLGKNSSKLKNGIKLLMKNIFNAISPYVCTKENLSKGISFQLFGCDVAPDENFNSKLIEINKGPDMGFKDGRDGDLKKSVMMSIFNLINLNDDMKNEKYDNRFIPL